METSKKKPKKPIIFAIIRSGNNKLDWGRLYLLRGKNQLSDLP